MLWFLVQALVKAIEQLPQRRPRIAQLHNVSQWWKRPLRSRWAGVGDLWQSKQGICSTFLVSKEDCCLPFMARLYSGVWKYCRPRSSDTIAGWYAICQLVLIATVWHWSQPPGGGMLFQVVNMLHPVISMRIPRTAIINRGFTLRFLCVDVVRNSTFYSDWKQAF